MSLTLRINAIPDFKLSFFIPAVIIYNYSDIPDEFCVLADVSIELLSERM